MISSDLTGYVFCWKILEIAGLQLLVLMMKYLNLFDIAPQTMFYFFNGKIFSSGHEFVVDESGVIQIFFCILQEFSLREDVL